MAVVVFNSADFKTLYPEFAGFETAQLQNCFNQATLFCNNTDASIVADITERTTLLYLLTAHLTKLTLGTNDGTNSEKATGLVGRVEVAKEGSVHVRADMGPATASGAWYNQTQYGATYWAATVKYRTMRYMPGYRPMPGLFRWIPWGW